MLILEINRVTLKQIYLWQDVILKKNNSMDDWK